MNRSAFTICLVIALNLISFSFGRAQWTFQPSVVTTTLTDIKMIDSLTAIAVGISGKIIKTIDKGKHWTIVQSGTQANLKAVDFRTKLEGYAVGDHVVCHTTDGGETWSSSAATDSYTAIAFGGNYPGAPIFFGTYYGYTHFSYDNGATWTEAHMGGGPIIAIANKSVLNAPFTIIASQDSVFQTFNGLQWTTARTGTDVAWDVLETGDLRWSTQFLVGWGGNPGPTPVFLRRTPTDTLWEYLGLKKLPYPLFLFDVQAFPDTPLVYVCGNTGKFLKSTDNGDTWISSNLPTRQFLRALSFYTHDNGFIVGDSGVIFHTDNGGITNAIQSDIKNIPTRTFLAPNFPNPFNPTTRVQFFLDEGAFVCLKIYNVLGMEIESLLSEWRLPGEYSFSWNASKYASGIYFCRLSTSRVSIMQKMVLAK